MFLGVLVITPVQVFLISDSILEQGTGANMLRNYFLFCFPVLP